MDRQPLTDRLGDRLLAEYGGAAVAYGLRALNGNGDSMLFVCVAARTTPSRTSRLLR
jgi:hypothetical protein